MNKNERNLKNQPLIMKQGIMCNMINQKEAIKKGLMAFLYEGRAQGCATVPNIPVPTHNSVAMPST